MHHTKHNVPIIIAVILIVLALAVFKPQPTGHAVRVCTSPLTIRTITLQTQFCTDDYYLRDAGNGALNINSADITLNCNGASIGGDGHGNGIVVNADNVTIKNCTINDYEIGVLVKANHLKILDSKITASRHSVLSFNYSDLTLDNLELDGASQTIHLTEVDNITIKNSKITGGKKDGIFLYAVQHGAITSNTITDCETGIRAIKDSQDLTIASNHISSCTDAIFMLDSPKNTFCSNLIESNSRGIYIKSIVGKNKLIRNTINKNSAAGLMIAKTYNNEITANTITESGDGILASDCFDNTFYANLITKNAIGLNMGESSQNNLFHHNEFINNNKHTSSPLSTKNAFYTTVNSTAQGNYWDTTSRVDITDTNGDSYGDAGTEYPLRSSLKAHDIGTGVIDNGPILDRKIISDLLITLPDGCDASIPTTESLATEEEPISPAATETNATNQTGVWNWLKSLFS